MRALREAPFPFETVRDLLGILRAMYACTRKQAGAERRLALIEQVGRELGKATDMARMYPRGSLGFTAAWERAESAVRRLGELVDCTTPLEPALKVVGERITRASAGVGESPRRELRRETRRKRS